MRKEGRHRRRKQAERKAFGLLLGVLLVLGGSLLFLNHSQGTERRDRIGNVDFTLSGILEDRLFAVPGQQLSKEAVIHLEKHSKPAYLRVRIFWGGLNGIMREELEQNLSLGTGWVKNPMDGYYYYQAAVNGGEAVCFFELLTVPEHWESRREEIGFCMKLHVEAAEDGKIGLLWNREGEINGWNFE